MADGFDLDPVLTGQGLHVRPLRPDDFAGLYAVAGDPLLWEQHPARNRHERPVFEAWFDAAQRQHALVVETVDGEIIGSSRYYHVEPALREVSIGYTFIARSHWGGQTNAALKSLMLDHAFAARMQRVWFHVNPSNQRSRRAMAKIGGVESHLGTLSINGEPPVEYVFYRIDAPSAGATTNPLEQHG